MITHREVLAKLLLYSAVYGFFMINYVDLLGLASDPLHAYHLWLIGMYFAPFVLILLIYGKKDWQVFLALGLLASLMNDGLFPLADQVMFGVHSCCGTLLDFYKFNLGFDGLKTAWSFQGGLIQFPVSSVLMGVSIYARVATVAVLISSFVRGNKA